MAHRNAQQAGVSARQEYRRARRCRARGQAGRAAVAGAAVALGVVAARGGGVIALVAAAVLAVAAVAWRPDPDPQRWARGAAGEEATADLLERLPSRQWSVLHDRSVPGLAVNLDHVVIGPGGVWLVDSKAYRAPLRARWRRVDAGDRPIDTGPAAWEADLVAERLGVAVIPIVAVHGTGLSRRGRRSSGVRIIPAAALPARLRRHRRVWTRAEADRLAARAERLLPPRGGARS